MNLLRTHDKDCVEFGVDEVGRGCLFGPVCVCCVYVPENVVIPDNLKIRDSKKTTPKQREKIMEFIKNTPDIKYKVCLIDNNRIDEVNILQATYDGMHKSIREMGIEPEHLVIDGNRFRFYQTEQGEIIPHCCVKQADDKYLHVSIAANIAKYTRDQWIATLCEENPILNEYYSMGSNKGYGTKAHMNGIKEYGITKYHRTSFNPCSNIEKIVNLK